MLVHRLRRWLNNKRFFGLGVHFTKDTWFYQKNLIFTFSHHCHVQLQKLGCYYVNDEWLKVEITFLVKRDQRLFIMWLLGFQYSFLVFSFYEPVTVCERWVWKECGLLFWRIYSGSTHPSSVVQSQTAVSAYFTSKKILHFGSAVQSCPPA